MLSYVFHRWERRLASAATDRVVRPFEWGADWIPDLERYAGDVQEQRLSAWAADAVANSEAFYQLETSDDYALTGDCLSFPSAVITPHPSNNIVRARWFPEPSPRGRRRAVLVLPQWNADAEGHVGLCRLLNRFG